MLISEVMLQQTQVSRVVPAWESFMAAYPTVPALAQAALPDVLRAWKGMGYNRRAVALWKAARVIVDEHGGVVPHDVAALQRLPGVGPYTAAAVAACAYGVPVAAVDVNVARVVARARLAWGGPGAASAKEVAAAAGSWVDRQDPGAWNQALMDLGRTVCRVREPLCERCPIASGCRLHRSGGRAPEGAEAACAHARRPLLPRFEGSSRQLRGRIIDSLREADSASLGALARRWDAPVARVAAAVVALDREGLVHAGPAALEGRPNGRVRLGSGTP